MKDKKEEQVKVKRVHLKNKVEAVAFRGILHRPKAFIASKVGNNKSENLTFFPLS